MKLPLQKLLIQILRRKNNRIIIRYFFPEYRGFIKSPFFMLSVIFFHFDTNLLLIFAAYELKMIKQ
jgi:hypothetical protein